MADFTLAAIGPRVYNGRREETPLSCPVYRFTSLLSIPVLAAALAAPTTSQRTGPSTFYEEAAGLRVFADGHPASLTAEDSIVPVPVAIALLRNGASVAFTLESFTLADAQGNRVPALGFTAVKNGYPRLDFDRELMRAWPIMPGGKIGDRPNIASNFYPPTGEGTRIARVELAPFSWFSDLIYFPRPPAGLGGVMTLSVAVADGDSIDVRLLMSKDEFAK